MAQRIMLIDDLDGSEASTTLTYAIDGQEYEIDLSEENAEKFRTTLAPFIKTAGQLNAGQHLKRQVAGERDGAAGEQVDAMTCR